MASGNSSSGSPKIDLRLSEQSQAELKRFLQTMQQVEKTVKATNTAFKTVSGSIGQNAAMLQGVQQDMKQLKLISDAMKRNAMMLHGPGSYMQGQQFRENRRAENTSRLGTGIGQQIELQREYLSLAKKGLSYTQQQATIQQALNLKLGMQARTVSKITDLDKARQLMAAASVRQGLEAANGEARRAKSAQRIYDLAKARAAVLEQEKRTAEALAKAEEKRAQRLKQLRQGDRQMERAEAAANRRKTLERLRGDGGAGLFAIQANVMANYVAMSAARNAVVGGVQFTADLDESLRNLQAITVITDENLGGLKETILQVSEATKFYATDIANAAVTLGQAGFSTKEIQDSVRAVALLATATGTDLAKSVDLTTSILGVFKMESEQMTGVAHTLTAAVNNSKLNLDKLTLGLQYAGNTAAQSGVSFEELTASLGAMANAGIRSGSTLGTGMRQILMALQKPSGKFADALDRLGLSMEDVDLRSKGLYGVMKTLKDSGFTAADAIRSFEVRAASAFNALSGNLGEVVKLERAFLNSSAAAKANETQMRAMTNQGRRFQANLQAVISTGLEPMAYAVRDLLSWMADLMQSLREAPEALQKVVVGFAALGAAFVAIRATVLIASLAKMALGFGTLITTIQTATSAAVAFRGVLALMLGPVGLATVAVTAGMLAFGSYRTEVEKAGEALSNAQTHFDNATGAMEAVGSQITMVNGRIKELTDRADMLTKNEDLLQLETEKVREQFREMGIELSENVGGVDELIAALKVLRGELAKDYNLKFAASQESLERLLEANELKANAIRSTVSGRAGHRVINRELEREGYQGVGDLLGKAADPNATLTELHRVRNELESFQAQMTANDNGNKALMTEQLDYLNQLIQLKESNLSLDRQLQDTRREALVLDNKEEHSGLVERVDSFGAGARAEAHRSVDGIEGAVPRFEAGRRAVMDLQAQAKAFKEEIDLQGDKILPEVREELLQKIQNNLAEAEIFLDGLLEAAKDASETRAELEKLEREATDAKLETSLNLTGNETDIRSITEQRRANLQADYESDLADLRIQTGGNTNSDEYKAHFAQLTADFEAEDKRLVDEMKTALAGVLNNHLAQNKLRQDALVREIEKSGDADERAGMRRELASLLMEQAKLLKERAALEVTIAEELEVATTQIEQDLADGLEDLVDAGLSDEIKLAELNTQTAKDALDAVMRLGDDAKTHAENAAWYKKVLKAARKWADALRAEANLKADDDGVGEDSPASAAADIDKMFDGLETRRDRNTRRINRGKGGGNPNSRKRDEVDKLIDDLKSKLDVAENYLAAGQSVSGEYDTVMTDALAKVSEIHGQIETLQNKIANGGQLTVQEQERLNTLIDQQARMTTFIRQEEQRIALIKMQQGQIGEGILLTVKAWARENLNLEKTLQSGITNALNTAKSSLVEFFTALTDGTKSGKEAFRDLAVGILKSIQQIFAEMLAVYLLQKALGWVNSTFGLNLPIPSKEGGAVKNAAEGDYVQGNLNRDSKRYNLMPGEYVLRRSAVQAIGVDELDRLNAMGNRVVSTSEHQGAAAQPQSKAGKGGDMNIYLVDERTQPSQMGPNDVLAIVNDDIARGGTTKKLIKTVQAGNM